MWRPCLESSSEFERAVGTYLLGCIKYVTGFEAIRPKLTQASIRCSLENIFGLKQLLSFLEFPFSPRIWSRQSRQWSGSLPGEPLPGSHSDIAFRGWCWGGEKVADGLLPWQPSPCSNGRESEDGHSSSGLSRTAADACGPQEHARSHHAY